VPLAIHYYADAGLRPMSDVDLLVRSDDFARAGVTLSASGWWPAGGSIGRGLHPYLAACEWRRSDGLKLDLHQFLIEHGSTPATEAACWAHARPLDVHGSRCCMPDATDLFLHVCVAGLKRGRAVNARWIADACLIVARDVVDWDALSRRARDRGVVLVLRDAVRFLAGEFRLGVPPAALEALDHPPAHPWERRTARLLRRHSGSLRELTEEYLGLYRSGTRAAGHRPTALGFLRFSLALLVHRWALQSAWQLPRTAVRRLGRRIGLLDGT
jgi:hypothetical protein